MHLKPIVGGIAKLVDFGKVCAKIKHKDPNQTIYVVLDYVKIVSGLKIF